MRRVEIGGKRLMFKDVRQNKLVYYKRIVKKKAQIVIPSELQFGLYGSLLLALFLFFLMYLILYKIGSIWGETVGWTVVTLGLLPFLYAIVLDIRPNGILVERSKQTKLVEIVKDVAEEIGVPIPDKILLTPTTGIFVMGHSEKYLCIGIASLRALTVGEFKSILAHESGHFYGGDTIIGDYLGRMRYTFEKSSELSAKLGWGSRVLELAILGSIISFCYSLYGWFFKAITHFYFRRMERRADLVAIHVGGAANFYNGLTNYAAFSSFFDKNTYGNIAKLAEEQKAYLNIYETTYKTYLNGDVKATKKKTIEEEKPGLFATHPLLRERLAAISNDHNETLKTPSTGLFNNFKELEEQMTKIITQNISNQLVLNRLYQEAVARQGKCKFCSLQCKTLQELLEHEARCSKNPLANKKSEQG